MGRPHQTQGYISYCNNMDRAVRLTTSWDHHPTLTVWDYEELDHIKVMENTIWSCVSPPIQADLTDKKEIICMQIVSD